MSHADFIPRPDAAFETFFYNITAYFKALTAEYALWNAAYKLTLKPHAPQVTWEKNRVRLIAERALSPLRPRFRKSKLIRSQLSAR